MIKMRKKIENKNKEKINKSKKPVQVNLKKYLRSWI